jgi:uncharacterized protein
MILRRNGPVVAQFAWLALLLLAVAAILPPLHAQMAHNLPPKPAGYFTDEPGLIDATTAHAINEELAQFERDTSNQILVAIYPKLPDGEDLASYAIATGNLWKAGTKDQSNGAILFVFVQDRKIFIATGRGLEGALPDAICNNIIRQVIQPRFRQGDYAVGIQAGVDAMIAATKGEYKGSGTTQLEQQQGNDSGSGIPVWVIILFIILFIVARQFLPSGSFSTGPVIYGGGFGGGYGGRGGFGGGGGGGGGFSGFSGGGGSFGGGGAGGSW